MFTGNMAVTYFLAIIIAPFAGVILSYLLAKKKTGSEEIGIVMVLSAIASMVAVSLVFPIYWLFTV